MSFTTEVKFQTGLSLIRVSCKRALSLFFAPFYILEMCCVVSCNVQQNRHPIHSLNFRSSDITGKQRSLLFQMGKRASTACKFCYPFLTWWLKYNFKSQIFSEILDNKWNWSHLFVRNCVSWSVWRSSFFELY